MLWRPSLVGLAAVLLFLAVAPPGSSGAQSPIAPAPAAASFVVEGLGKGTVAIDGQWQFHLGDDPAWASPAFDDSGWEQLRADRPWGAQGHEAQTGFAWYRRRVTFPRTTGPPQEFALLLGNIDDACEVYWNGHLVGRDGQPPPHPVWYSASQPKANIFPMGAMVPGVLAIRVWKSTLSSRESGERGGFESAPLVGTPEGIANYKAALDLDWGVKHRLYTMLYPIYALVAAIAFLAWLRDRRQWLLFWTAWFAIAPPLEILLNNLRLPIPKRVALSLLLPVNGISDVSLWVLLILLLQLGDIPALMRATRIVAALMLASTFLDGLLAYFLWPSPWALTTQVLDAGLTAIILLLEPYLLVLVAVAVLRRSRLDRERWLMAASACLAQGIYALILASEQGVRFTHWTLAERLRGHVFVLAGTYFSLQAVADILLLVSMVYAVYRYSAAQNERQNVLEQEYKSARELQRVLIPETLPSLDGYAVTSAYQPAQQVGGDFFQLIRQPDGSALLVLGDVSGKGLKAAMTVSLIVGAVRTLAENTGDPAQILAGLNRRLHGRLDSGFATCLALRFDAAGDCVIANAGHPPPFRNSEEMELPGALPLGIDPDASYESTAFSMGVGDRLTLYTDGLLEARNPAGEIFSFDRLRALIATAPDASRAAEAAVAFGQDDDITVLTLTRLATGVKSTTSLLAPELSHAPAS